MRPPTLSFAALAAVCLSASAATAPIRGASAATAPSKRERSSSSVARPASAFGLPRPRFRRLFAKKKEAASAAASSPSAEAMWTIPAIFNSDDDRPIVLFDGKCNLCNGGVQLLLDLDRASDDPRGNLRVAALQSRVGKVLLARLPEGVRSSVVVSSSSDDEEEEAQDYKSIVVCAEDRTWVDTSACLRIGRAMRGPLRYASLAAYAVPPFVRNRAYRFLSKRRKKIFGERDECRLWDDNFDTRFVDDTLLGGRTQQEDPFADPNAPPPLEEAEPGPIVEPLPPKEGRKVRVISERPIVFGHVPDHPEGVCVSGCVGTVSRVLNERSYEKPIVVEFDAPGKYEAHFVAEDLKEI